jgi:5-methyltetrahydropteroyltriglutamate--homocysteine methyltransferase
MPENAQPRPPFRADHVGSLLRPKALREAFRSHGAADPAHPDFVAALERAIRGAVAMQEDVGLDVITDGEFRRSSYWGRFVERCEGFLSKPAVFAFRDELGQQLEFTATYAGARLRRTEPLASDEFEFLRRLTQRTAKITLPAPSTMHFYRFSDFADPSVYPDGRGFFADLARIYRAEIADLVAAGATYVQLDEVALAMLCDPDIRAKVAIHEDPDRLVDLYIDAINACLAGTPAGLRIGIHMCRGNFRGRYLSQGGYESVAERLFERAKVSHFLLEYDTERAGDFSPLRFVPEDKGVVLGLISTKTPRLESMDELKRRVAAAARYIDQRRLGISPQCGFASTAAGNPLSEAEQRAKLRLVVEAARSIWT